MLRQVCVVACAIVATGCLPATAAEPSPDLSHPVTPDERRLLSGDLLGKRLFEDTRLSEPQGVSCASCHDPSSAYRGNNRSPVAAVAAGARPGILGNRKTPSVLYMAYSPPFDFIMMKSDITGVPEITPVGGQFWDGRAVDLSRQVEGPLLNPREMNNPSIQAVVNKVRNGPYADLAREVYGTDFFDDPGAFSKLSSAIASYEASARFKPFSSKFDAWLEGETNLTDQEFRGFQSFIDPKKGNCLSCHEGGHINEAMENEGPPTLPQAELSRNPKNWIFTDFTYDTLGAPRNMAIPDNANPDYFDLGLCRRPGLSEVAPKDFDRETLCGAFKTPSLRNVALNAPYMHNGVFKTLRDAVAFYFTRDTNPERWYPRTPDGLVLKFNDLPEKYRSNVNVRQVPYDRRPGESPRATDAEIDDIVAFLQTLTDRSFGPPAAQVLK